MENCEYCKREYTKTPKGKIIRRFIEGKTVCTKCAGNMKRRDTFAPSKVIDIDYKMICDYCTKSGRTSSKVKQLFVCHRCKRSYDYNGYIKPPRIKRTPEERKELIRKRSKEKSDLIKERKAYIATLTPDQLLQLVREDIEEGRI